MGGEVQKWNGSGDKKLSAESGSWPVPAMVARAGERGAYRFLEFFAAQIRNPNTRATYFWNVCNFFTWCERRHVRELSGIRSAHVASYIERLSKTHAAPSVK